MLDAILEMIRDNQSLTNNRECMKNVISKIV